MGYKFAYLDDRGYIRTPRGDLRVECIFNSEAIAREHGYDIYFTVHGLGIFTKHIDTLHLLFAVVDKQSPIKYKQIAPKEYYIDLHEKSNTTFIARDKLIREYKKDKETNETFNNWCFTHRFIEIKNGTYIKLCKNIEIRKKSVITHHRELMNQLYPSSTNKVTEFVVVGTSASNLVYLRDEAGAEYITTVQDINKAGVQLLYKEHKPEKI